MGQLHPDHRRPQQLQHQGQNADVCLTKAGEVHRAALPRGEKRSHWFLQDHGVREVEPEKLSFLCIQTFTPGWWSWWSLGGNVHISKKKKKSPSKAHWHWFTRGSVGMFIEQHCTCTCTSSRNAVHTGPSPLSGWAIWRSRNSLLVVFSSTAGREAPRKLFESHTTVEHCASGT